MTDQKYLKVINDNNLVRDVESKAILSTNKTLLEEHRQKRQFFKNIASQAEEISQLKSDIGEIKMLLNKLLLDK